MTLDRGRPVEVRNRRLQPLVRDACEERDEAPLALVGVRCGGDTGLGEDSRRDPVLGREPGMERLRHGAELALGAGGETGGEAERGGGLRGVEAEQPGASRSRRGRPQCRRGVPALEVVGHVDRLAEPGHHLDAHDERIHAGRAVGAAFLPKRQQGGHQCRTDVRVADLQHVVVVQRMGCRAVDQRSPGCREPVRRAGDDRAATRTPPRHRVIGRARGGVGRPRQHAGGGIDEGAACPAPRFLAPTPRRLGDPLAELDRGAGRVIRRRSACHRPSPLALSRADGTPWQRGRNRAEEGRMTVLVLVRALAKPGKGADVVDMLTPFVGEDTEMEGCSRIEMAIDATDPDRVLLLEEWTSAEAHKANLAALEAASGLDDFLALLAEDPIRTYYAPLDG